MCVTTFLQMKTENSEKHIILKKLLNSKGL